jgi:hypothetical protein
MQDMNCYIMTAEDCDAQNGIYQGDGTPCEPNPCAAIPTRNATWGQIKGLFR